MSAKDRNYTWFEVVRLALGSIGLGGGRAAVRLKILSESLNADSISEIRELIRDGVDVNVRNKYSVTPLFMASRDGHSDVGHHIGSASKEKEHASDEERPPYEQPRSPGVHRPRPGR